MPRIDPEQRRLYSRAYYQQNKERIQERNRVWHHRNRDEIIDKKRQYYLENKKELNAKAKQQYQRNKQAYKDRARRWKQANRDRVRELARASGQRRKEHLAAYKKRYDQENKAKIAAKNREYYQRNKERINERNREAWKADPEKACQYAKNRRARLLAAPGTHTADDVRAIWEAQGKKCAVVGCTNEITERGPWRYTVDHKTPLVRGGSNDVSNLQILCKTHNSQKHDLTVDEWIAIFGIALITGQCESSPELGIPTCPGSPADTFRSSPAAH